MIVRDDYADDIDDEEDRDDDETMPCPHCGESVYDDAERCPECGRYLSPDDISHRKPWWVVAGAVVCLAMMTWWILHP